MKWKLVVHVYKIIPVGCLQLQRPKIQLRLLFDKREPIDLYLRVCLATCGEDKGLKQHPSHSALLCADDTHFLCGRSHMPSVQVSLLSAFLPRLPAGIVGPLGVGAHAQHWTRYYDWMHLVLWLIMHL